MSILGLGLLSAISVAATEPNSETRLSASYLKEIDRAISSQAGRDPQWLNLGHWRPRGFVRKLVRSEFRSEADGEEFFLSLEGKNDPEAELRETLKAFAKPLAQGSDEAVHPQCLFPARRKWAFSNLGWERVLREHEVPIYPCSARQAWKKQLDANGVSLVFAAAYLGNAASMFGHTFLKFHSKLSESGRDLLDYGVNFAAETGSDGGVPFAVFGMTGRYPGRFSMQPFHQTLNTYANVEGRDLVEYKLNLTTEEIDFFVDHLFELEKTYFDYYFLTENCSYFLLAALEAAKPDLKLSQSFFYQVIPADSIRQVARTPGLVTETKYRPSLAAMFRARTVQMTSADASFARRTIDGAEAPSEAEISSASLEALDLALDYGAIRATSSSKFDTLNHRLRTERARRGRGAPVAVLESPPRPEEGHDPGRVGILIRESKNRKDVGFEFRFANHDRLSLDDGYLRGTSLEVFRLKAFSHDTFQSQSSFRLEEATLLDIFSAQPMDAFSMPSSWTFALGFREPLRSKSLGPYLRTGLGATFALGRFVWITSLIGGEAISNPDIKDRWAAWLGPELNATFFLSHRLKFGIDAKLARALNPTHHYDSIKGEFAWSLSRNSEIRAAGSYSNSEGFEETQWMLKAYHHLLF